MPEIDLETLSRPEHGYTVDDEDDDDPVLLDQDGNHIETWRERYPYDDRMAHDEYEPLKPKLRRQPDLIGSALEEMLRYDSPSTSVVWRFPTEDVEIAGVAIPSGDPVLPLISAANRDPAVFADPDGFEIARTDLDHVSFGYGPHFCVGAALGRLEAGIALPALLARFPALSLGVPRDELRFRSAFMTRGLPRLPVRW